MPRISGPGEPVFSVFCSIYTDWNKCMYVCTHPNSNINTIFSQYDTTTPTPTQFFSKKTPQPNHNTIFLPKSPKFVVLAQLYHKIGVKIGVITRKKLPQPNHNQLFLKSEHHNHNTFFQKLPPLPQTQFLDFYHHNPNPYHNFRKVNITTATTTQFLGKNYPKLG